MKLMIPQQRLIIRSYLTSNFLYLILFMTLFYDQAEARIPRLLQLNVAATPSELEGIHDTEILKLTQMLSDTWHNTFKDRIELISPQSLAESLPSDFDPTSCGPHCPLIIGRAARADLVSHGTLSRIDSVWQLHLIVKDTSKEKDVFDERLKGTHFQEFSERLSAILIQKADEWGARLSEISIRPERIFHAEQATRSTSGRWSELGITWIPIKGALFEMGHPSSHPSERPVHAVEVSNFQMMKTEVTADQYWACVQAQVCSPTPEREGCVSLGPNAREAVNCVTWLQARTFAEWIGARLPTEMEWELAAKGSEGRRYPWGNEEATCDRLSFAAQEGNDGCGDPSAQAPCSYPRGQSPLGLCDLAGNLWEWVADDWHKDYRAAPTKGAWCQPTHDLKRSCTPSKRGYKTYRGGSWYHPASRAQSTSRSGALHSTESVGVGFRCAL